MSNLYNTKLTGCMTAEPPCTGVYSYTNTVSKTIAEGNGDGESNSVYKTTINLPSSGVVDVNLFAVENIANEDFLDDPSEMVAGQFVNSGPGTVEISPTPGAGVGWISWLAAGSVLRLPPGASVQFEGAPLGTYPVGGADGFAFRVEEVGGDSTSLEVFLLGRKL